MKDDFLQSLARVLVYEGGKADNPNDPGGRTNQGVTQATYAAYRRSKGLPYRDVYLMENGERDDIYQSMYWTPARGDELPVGVDLCVFDAAVNSGLGRAVKWLQAALGDHYTGQLDGVIGTKTMLAVSDFGDPDALVMAYCSRRLATLQQLTTWKYFGVGWAARIANVQKTACAWIGGAPEPPAVNVTVAGGHNKAPVSTGVIKGPAVSQIAAHVGTAATSAGTIASQTAQQLTSLQELFANMKYVFAGLTVLTVILGIVAKIAMDAKAAAESGTATSEVNLDADAVMPAVPVAPRVLAPPVQVAATGAAAAVIAGPACAQPVQGG